MKILKKEWFIWKFWKKGGVVEKRGEEETKSMPHAPVEFHINEEFEFEFEFINVNIHVGIFDVYDYHQGDATDDGLSP